MPGGHPRTMKMGLNLGSSFCFVYLRHALCSMRYAIFYIILSQIHFNNPVNSWMDDLGTWLFKHIVLWKHPLIPASATMGISRCLVFHLQESPLYRPPYRCLMKESTRSSLDFASNYWSLMVTQRNKRIPLEAHVRTPWKPPLITYS